MIRTQIGSCSGCGLGVTLPHSRKWHPGKTVVVLDEAELTKEQLARLTEITGDVVFKPMMAFSPVTEVTGEEQAQRRALAAGFAKERRKSERKLLASIKPTPPRRHIFMLKPQWEEKIRRGHKTSTIRPLRKRRPVEGDIAEFRVWTGKPYRSKQRIIGEAVINFVDEIIMTEQGIKQRDATTVPSLYLKNVCAQQDGFQDYNLLWTWFRKEYGWGITSFEGVRTCWDSSTLRLQPLEAGKA